MKTVLAYSIIRVCFIFTPFRFSFKLLNILTTAKFITLLFPICCSHVPWNVLTCLGLQMSSCDEWRDEADDALNAQIFSFQRGGLGEDFSFKSCWSRAGSVVLITDELRAGVQLSLEYSNFWRSQELRGAVGCNSLCCARGWEQQIFMIPHLMELLMGWRRFPLHRSQVHSSSALRHKL